MNLLMLSGDSSVAQGREGAFDQMLRRFSRWWERIDILCPPARGAKPRTLHGNVYVHPSPLPKVLQPLFIRRKGAELLAERPYALMTSHDFGLFYNGWGAAWLANGSNIPYVSELHHIEGYPRAVTRKDRLYRALAMRYIPWAERRVAAFRVVNALEVPELLRKLGVPDEKILVLPSLYIDFELFRPLPYVPRNYDVVFIGRLVSNKGIFTLLDAVKQVKATHPGIRLGILGRGPLKADIEAYIARELQGSATLITEPIPPEKVAHFYNGASMLVCASTAEGGPRVTVEAMACAVPVISTPVGIMRELIVDGENGLVFHWDAGELAAKIRLLLDDEALRSRLGRAGQASVARFQADQVIEGYARGYHDLIERIGR